MSFQHVNSICSWLFGLIVVIVIMYHHCPWEIKHGGMHHIARFRDLMQVNRLQDIVHFCVIHTVTKCLSWYNLRAQNTSTLISTAALIILEICVSWRWFSHWTDIIWSWFCHQTDVIRCWFCHKTYVVGAFYQAPAACMLVLEIWTSLSSLIAWHGRDSSELMTEIYACWYPWLV